jgi:hypothetical protein
VVTRAGRLRQLGEVQGQHAGFKEFWARSAIRSFDLWVAPRKFDGLADGSNVATKDAANRSTAMRPALAASSTQMSSLLGTQLPKFRRKRRPKLRIRSPRAREEASDRQGGSNPFQTQFEQLRRFKG